MVIQNQQRPGDIEDMSKKSCIIYDSWGELLINLPDEMAGELIKHILAYAFDRDIGTSENPAIGAMFAMIKSKLDEDADAYEEIKNMRSEAARKRWSECKTMQKHANACKSIKDNTEECKSMQKDAVSVSDSVSVSDKDKKDILSDQVSEIVDHLNEQLGTRYKKNSKTTTSQIKARLDEGYSVEDFKTVIDKKVKAWKDDPKMSAYLRPETLFRPGHFESYLNEIKVDKESPPGKSIYGMSQATYGKIHNYNERKVDYAELEAWAIGNDRSKTV